MPSKQWRKKRANSPHIYSRAEGYKNVHHGSHRLQRTQVSPTTNGQHNSSNLLDQDGGENEASRNGQNYYGDVEPFSIQKDHNYCLILANCNKTEVDC